MKTTKFSFGDIVLVSFPFSDATSFKRRPCLILKEHEQDALVVFISSQLNQKSQHDFILRMDNTNNLAVDSLVKIWKINVLHKSLIFKKIGFLGKEDRVALKSKLINFFTNI